MYFIDVRVALHLRSARNAQCGRADRAPSVLLQTLQSSGPLTQLA
jgi:hypothetical protein